MSDFAGSFMVTDDILVRKRSVAERDGPGDALPITVIRQLFSEDYLKRLGAMNEELPRVLRVAAETGRRPGELLTLYYSCLDLDSPGSPYLIYTESKVTRGQVRRLPILDVVVSTVRAQQDQVRQRFLADQIDTAAGERQPAKEGLPPDHITVKSLQTELATAKHRNQEFSNRVQALERRLGAQGAVIGPSVIDNHPLVLELQARLAYLEIQLVEKDRAIESLEDDVDVLRETNRSLVREYGLSTGT